jgi:alkenylglycerophosphocholine/alkenylglycerophosphoethanolamine hydrolase
MITALSACAAIAAALAIAADWSERRHRAFYVLKPLTTLLIVGIALAAPAADSPYQAWIVAALLLSLVGDVCLMFTHGAGASARGAGNRWFLGGLGAFLLAHGAFAAAFLQGVAAPNPPGWLAAVVFYAGGLLFVLLPRAGALKIPVLLYCFALAAMVFAAAARHAALADGASLCALLGALLFMLSDSALGWRRFVGRFRHAQAVILSTYWAAIGLIAWSV